MSDVRTGALVIRGGPDIRDIRIEDEAGNVVPALMPTKKSPLRIESRDGTLYALQRVPVRLDLHVRPKDSDLMGPRICPECERTFTPTHGGQVYCSRVCGQKHARLKKTGGPQNRVRAIPA